MYIHVHVFAFMYVLYSVDGRKEEGGREGERGEIWNGGKKGEGWEYSAARKYIVAYMYNSYLRSLQSAFL